MSISLAGYVPVARRALAGGLLAACAACAGSGATNPSPLMTGAYALLRYNGKSLPFEIGPMPPKGQNPGGCPVRITAGMLAISVAPGTFSYTYEIRNGCTQELMSQPGLQGTYEQRGRDVTFIVTRTDGLVTRYAGSVSDSRVIFRSEDEVLEFAK